MLFIGIFFVLLMILIAYYITLYDEDEMIHSYISQ